MMTNVTMLARDRFILTKQAIISLTMAGTRDMSLTILDDRSLCDTRELLAQVGAVRNNTPMGTGPLRNLVIRESERRHGRGDFLVLSDNDVAFKQGWLPALISCYQLAEEHGFRVIGGLNHPFHQPVSKLPLGMYAVNEVNALATQSWLMRWSTWDEFGPFVETPVDKVCQSEDVEMTNRIRAAGFKLGVVSPAQIVSTGITNTFGEHIPGYELVKRQCPPGVVCE